jgi:hypothetical protein
LFLNIFNFFIFWQLFNKNTIQKSFFRLRSDNNLILYKLISLNIFKQIDIINNIKEMQEQQQNTNNNIGIVY